MKDIVIIGAGPYGISLAAYAEACGLSYVLLGRPMHFWKDQMPQTMFIRTNPRYISLSDPADSLTITRYSEEQGIQLTSPFPRPDFVDYAFWFARQAGVTFTPELAVSLDKTNDGFLIRTETGKAFLSAQVVIATGLQHSSYIPSELSTLPPALLSHTYGLTEFNRFQGHKVAVVGSGQSAWEAAALLHLAGSDTELLFRKESVQYAGEDNLASGLRLIESAEQFYTLPLEQKQARWNTPRQGSVAPFLKPYVEGKVTTTGNSHITSAAAVHGKARLELSSGETRMVDHVIAATGYRLDIKHLPFLSSHMLNTIEREAGFERFPKLNERFESSVPGLYFAGPIASHTHGPAYGFVAGLRHACRSIIPYMQQNKGTG